MNLLKERIKEKGIMQKRLAEKIDISESYFNYVVNKKRELSYSLAKKLYKELGYNSPISVILEYYGFSDDKDLNKFIEDKQITETVGNIILTHFRNNDLSRKEKAEFLGSILAVAGQLIEKGKTESFEGFREAGNWKTEEPEGVKQ